jgi:hypothetical protein
VTGGVGGQMNLRRWRRRKDCAHCEGARCGKTIDDKLWRVTRVVGSS